MTKYGANTHPTIRGGWRLWLKGCLLLFALWLAWPVVVCSQEENRFASGVKVLAALQGDVYAWSPTGERLAYATDDGIWVVEAPDFRQPRRLIRKGRGADQRVAQIRWSPDGQRLAFTSRRPGDHWDTIWLVEADGSHVRDLLPPGSPFGSPGSRAVGINTWLSNQEIAFIQRCGTGCLALNKIDINSGASWGFCSGKGSFYWTPAKDRAVVDNNSSGPDPEGLGLVAGSDAGPVPSTASVYVPPEEPCRSLFEGCVPGEAEPQGEGYQFDGWSPDGRRALYTGWACGEDPNTGSKFNLYLWEIQGDRRERLLDNAGWAAWSPDGSQIAFLLFGEPRYNQSKRIIGTDFAADKPARVSLGVMEAATRSVPTLVPLGAEPVDPAQRLAEDWPLLRPLWSPDGKQLAVRTGRGDLFLLRADGKDLRPLTRGMKMEAAWSPDGKRLALWIVGRHSAREDVQGLEAFLPPVGVEAAAVSDAELIEGYFQRILAMERKALGYSYLEFLGAYARFQGEYARVLEERGEGEAAEERYRKALTFLRSVKWHGTPWAETDLKGSYAAFLRRQGRGEEAAQLTSAAPPPERGRLLSRVPPAGRREEGFFIVPGKAPEGQASPGPHRVEPPPIPQAPPSLFIVEAPETGE